MVDMKWIKVEESLPPHKDAGYSETVLISDGKYISVGYHEFEYFAESLEEELQYSSPLWHDDAHLLMQGIDGWPDVTHWMHLPGLPT